MTDIDLDKLEALARAATAGPWTYKASTLGGLTLPYLVQSHGARRGIAEGYKGGESDLEFIVATGPDVVLELIERLRKAEGSEDPAWLDDPIDYGGFEDR